MIVDVREAELHESLIEKGFSHFQYKDLLDTEVHVYCLKVWIGEVIDIGSKSENSLN